MATGNGVNQGKTAFLEEFLPDNRDADEAAINQAWRAEGHDDDISGSLVSKTRSRLKIPKKRGATGGADGGPKAKGKAKPKGAKGKVARRQRRPRLSPTAGRATRGRASRRSSGSCSAVSPRPTWRRPTGVVRGGPRGGDQPFGLLQGQAGTGRDRRASGESAPGTSRARGVGGRESPAYVIEAPQARPMHAGCDRHDAGIVARSRATWAGCVDEVEAGIDDLMFTLKVNGGMPEVEAALRAARRLLVRSNGA